MEEPTQMSTLSAVHETINVPRKVSWSGFLLSLLAGAIACSTSYAGPNGMSTNGAEAMALAEAGEIDANDPVKCQFYPAIPVALGPDALAAYVVSGELCATQDELIDGTTVQLLIHGSTYNRGYWNFGRVNGIRYSYSRDVAARGFPTFALDELGSGNSAIPPSGRMTIEAAAFVAHQIVEGLRNGWINGVQFGKVILVGHSLGSVVAWQEAISYGDVDGVIVTGAAHFLTSAFLDLMPFYPAAMDPKFSDKSLDDGYLTTTPGIRAAAFYNDPDADPAVIALDEKRKDIVPGIELATGLPVVTSTATRAIQVPVLTILGSNDLPTCGSDSQGNEFDCSSGEAIASQEAPFYSPKAQIYACMVPGSGHALSLELSNQFQVKDSVAWSYAFVGQRPFDQKHDFDEGEDGLDDMANHFPYCGGPRPEQR